MADGPASLKKRSASSLNLTALTHALSQPDIATADGEGLDNNPITERSRSRIIKKEGTNSRYMLDQPIESTVEKKTEPPLAMSLQEKIRLGIFLQSIGVPLTEMDNCNNFIQERIHKAYQDPGHISNLVSEKKLLISCIGLMNKRAVTLGKEISVIKVQRTVRGYLDRKRLADLHQIYADVDWKGRNKTIIEFLENETQYCLNLSYLANKYIPQVISIISKNETDKIFSNVVDLFEKHSMLIRELEALMDNFPHVIDIGLIWLKKATFLPLYGDYVFNISHAETTLRRLWDENSKFKSIVISIHRQLSSAVYSPITSLTTSLASSLVTNSDSALTTNSRFTKKAEKESIAIESLEFLVKILKLPQERINYYHSTIQEIAKNTTRFHPDYTHLQVTLGTLHKLEELIAKKISYSKQRNAILEIERRLQDYKDGDIGSDSHGCPREYIREDIAQCHASFSQKGKQQKVVVILFSDLLLFAKSLGGEHDSKLKHMRSFPLLPSMRVDTKHPKAIYQKSNYSINLLDSKQELVSSFLCANQGIQELWLKDFQRVLKELKLAHSTVYGTPILEMVKRVSNKHHPFMSQIVSKLPEESIANVSALCIPKFMSDIVRAIESKGLLTKGIYRVSADIEHIDDIRSQIDSLKPVSEEFFQSFPIFALCDTFKLLFRSFPSPLLTFDLYEPILKMQSSYDESPEEYAKEIRSLFITLPLINYAILKFLACHLCKVEHAAGENLMNTTNLAIVFGPTLLYPKEETMEAALRMSKVYSVVCCMIDYFELVFCDKPPVKKNRLSLVIKTCPLSKSASASPRQSLGPIENVCGPSHLTHSLKALLESQAVDIERAGSHDIDIGGSSNTITNSNESTPSTPNSSRGPHIVDRGGPPNPITNSNESTISTPNSSRGPHIVDKLTSTQSKRGGGGSRRVSLTNEAQEESPLASKKSKRIKDKMAKTNSGGITPSKEDNKDNKDKDKDSPIKKVDSFDSSGSDLSLRGDPNSLSGSTHMDIDQYSPQDNNRSKPKTSLSSNAVDKEDSILFNSIFERERQEKERERQEKYNESLESNQKGRKVKKRDTQEDKKDKQKGDALTEEKKIEFVDSKNSNLKNGDSDSRKREEEERIEREVEEKLCQLLSKKRSIHSSTKNLGL